MIRLTFYNVRRMDWFRPGSLADDTTNELQLAIQDGQPDIGTFAWRDHGNGRHVPCFHTFCDGWAHLPDSLIGVLRSLGSESGGPCASVADVEAALLAIGAVDVSDRKPTP